MLFVADNLYSALLLICFYDPHVFKELCSFREDFLICLVCHLHGLFLHEREQPFFFDNADKIKTACELSNNAFIFNWWGTLEL